MNFLTGSLTVITRSIRAVEDFTIELHQGILYVTPNSCYLYNEVAILCTPTRHQLHEKE